MIYLVLETLLWLLCLEYTIRDRIKRGTAVRMVPKLSRQNIVTARLKTELVLEVGEIIKFWIF